MKQITKARAFKILAGLPLFPNWTILTKKNGRGDYGIDETYIYDGKPVIKLSIAYTPPYTIAYDLRGEE